MKSIGLIAAMQQESAALLHIVRGWEKTSVGPLPGYQMEISGQSCLLVTSGMGEKRAGEATRQLIEQASVACLISFGIAGAVEQSLEIGDVVLIEGVYHLKDGLPGKYLPLKGWTEAGIQSAGQVLKGLAATLYTGTAITTGGTQVPEALLQGTRHPVLEMETMGIAQVAAEKGIPFRAVRAISDGPRAPIPFDLGEMMDENANLRIGKLLKEISLHPRMVGGLRTMMRNSRQGADHAAITLVELLRDLPVTVG
jgi:adenosylhomocysteine nucleosidase